MQELQKYIEMNIFNEEQLYEIELGFFEDNLDVSLYADSKFDYKQMEFIRMALKKGFNPKDLIGKVRFDFLPLMAEINNLGLDINKYINKNEKSLKTTITKTLNKKVKELIERKGFELNDFTKGYIKVVKESILEGINISPYISKEFNYFQLNQIKEGIKDNLNVNVYANPEFNNWQMNEIRLGLKRGLDVSIYAKKYFSNSQMEQIRLGLLDNLNVNLYTYSEFSWQQMKTIRKSLKEGKFKRSDYFISKIIDREIKYIPKDF